jgi:negative regulator of sigma-B (phosphoserine phosphatase)
MQPSPLIEYAVSAVPAPGQAESGDLHAVIPTQRGALVAVIDGAGHGSEAASAARLAVSTLEAHPNEGLIPLLRRCHERLRGTRGAVMSLVSLDGTENTLTWLGVGNIEGVLLRSGSSMNPSAETIVLRPGIVGYRLPPLQAVITPVTPGDLLILTTDGIQANFVRKFAAEDQPVRIAEYISSSCSKGHDDCLVLVARYLGSDE